MCVCLEEFAFCNYPPVYACVHVYTGIIIYRPMYKYEFVVWDAFC